ncbi:MAG: hypothetical protein KatS3mg087_0421 [Patescibacteria group bacterium]|nr:MAG: hypothetical protein KatS3mg087_0421 [Patescibacteria group bacterium]
MNVAYRPHLFLLTPQTEPSLKSEDAPKIATIQYDIPFAVLEPSAPSFTPLRSSLRIADVIETVEEYVGKHGDEKWFKAAAELFPVIVSGRYNTDESLITFPFERIVHADENQIQREEILPKISSFYFSEQYSPINSIIKTKMDESIASGLVASITRAFPRMTQDTEATIRVIIPEQTFTNQELLDKMISELDIAQKSGLIKANLEIVGDNRQTPDMRSTIDAYSSFVPYWWIRRQRDNTRSLRKSKALSETFRMRLLMDIMGMQSPRPAAATDVLNNNYVLSHIEAGAGAGKSTIINRAYAFKTLMSLFPHEAMAMTQAILKLRGNKQVYSDLLQTALKVYDSSLPDSYIDEVVQNLQAALNSFPQQERNSVEYKILEAAKNFIETTQGPASEKLDAARFVAGLIENARHVIWYFHNEPQATKDKYTTDGEINIFRYLIDMFYNNAYSHYAFSLLPSSKNELLRNNTLSFDWVEMNFEKLRSMYPNASKPIAIKSFSLFQRPQEVIKDTTDYETFDWKDRDAELPELTSLKYLGLYQTHAYGNAVMTRPRVAVARNLDEMMELVGNLGLNNLRRAAKRMLQDSRSRTLSPAKTVDAFTFKETQNTIQAIMAVSPSQTSYYIRALRRKIGNRQTASRDEITKLFMNKTKEVTAAFQPFALNRFIVRKTNTDLSGREYIVSYNSYDLLLEFVKKTFIKAETDLTSPRNIPTDATLVKAKVSSQLTKIDDAIKIASTAFKTKVTELMEIIKQAGNNNEKVLMDVLKLIQTGGSDPELIGLLDLSNVPEGERRQKRQEIVDKIFEIRETQHSLLEDIIRHLLPIYYILQYANVEAKDVEGEEALIELSELLGIEHTVLFSSEPNSELRQKHSAKIIAHLLGSKQRPKEPGIYGILGKVVQEFQNGLIEYIDNSEDFSSDSTLKETVKKDIILTYNMEIASSLPKIAMSIVGSLSLLTDVMYRQISDLHLKYELIEDETAGITKNLYNQILTDIKNHVRSLSLEPSVVGVPIIKIAEANLEHSLTDVTTVKDILDFTSIFFEIFSRPISTLTGYYSPLFGGVGVPSVPIAHSKVINVGNQDERHVEVGFINAFMNGNRPNISTTKMELESEVPETFILFNSFLIQDNIQNLERNITLLKQRDNPSDRATIEMMSDALSSFKTMQETQSLMTSSVSYQSEKLKQQIYNANLAKSPPGEPKADEAESLDTKQTTRVIDPFNPDIIDEESEADEFLSRSFFFGEFVIHTVHYANQRLFLDPLYLFRLFKEYNQLQARKKVLANVHPGVLGLNENQKNRLLEDMTNRQDRIIGEINSILEVVESSIDVFRYDRNTRVFDRLLYRQRYGVFFNFLDYILLNIGTTELNKLPENHRTDDLFFGLVPRVLSITPSNGNQSATELGLISLEYRKENVVRDSKESALDLAYQSKPQEPKFMFNTFQRRVAELSTFHKNKPFHERFKTIAEEIEKLINENVFLRRLLNKDIILPFLPTYEQTSVLYDTGLQNTVDLLVNLSKWNERVDRNFNFSFNLSFEFPYIDTIYDLSYEIVSINNKTYIVPMLPFYPFASSARIIFIGPNANFHTLQESSSLTHLLNVHTSPMYMIDEQQDVPYFTLRTYKSLFAKRRRFAQYGTGTALIYKKVLDTLFKTEKKRSGYKGNMSFIEMEIIDIDDFRDQQNISDRDYRHEDLAKLASIVENSYRQVPNDVNVMTVGDMYQAVYKTFTGQPGMIVVNGIMGFLPQLRTTNNPDQPNVVETEFFRRTIPAPSPGSKTYDFGEYLASSTNIASNTGDFIDTLFSTDIIEKPGVEIKETIEVQDGHNEKIVVPENSYFVVEVETTSRATSADTPYDIVVTIKHATKIIEQNTEMVSERQILKKHIKSFGANREIYKNILETLYSILDDRDYATTDAFVVYQRSMLGTNAQEELIRAVSVFTTLLASIKGVRNIRRYDSKLFREGKKTLNMQIKKSFVSAQRYTPQWIASWATSIVLTALSKRHRVNALLADGFELSLDRNGNILGISEEGITMSKNLVEHIIRTADEKVDTELDSQRSQKSCQIITLTNADEWITQAAIAKILGFLYNSGAIILQNAQSQNDASMAAEFTEFLQAVKTLIKKLHTINVEQIKGGEANIVFLGPTNPSALRLGIQEKVLYTRETEKSIEIAGETSPEIGYNWTVDSVFSVGLRHDTFTELIDIVNPELAIKREQLFDPKRQERIAQRQQGLPRSLNPMFDTFGREIGGMVVTQSGELEPMIAFDVFINKTAMQIDRRHAKLVRLYLTAGISHGIPNSDRKANTRPRAATPPAPQLLIKPLDQRLEKIVKEFAQTTNKTYEVRIAATDKRKNYSMITKKQPSETIPNELRNVAKRLIETQVIPIIKKRNKEGKTVYVVANYMYNDGYITKYLVIPEEKINRLYLPHKPGERYINPILFKNKLILNQDGKYSGEFILQVGTETVKDNFHLSDETYQKIRRYVEAHIKSKMNDIYEAITKYHSGNKARMEEAKRIMKEKLKDVDGDLLLTQVNRMLKWAIFFNHHKPEDGKDRQTDIQELQDALIEAVMDIIAPTGFVGVGIETDMSSVEDDLLSSSGLFFSEENEDQVLDESIIQISYNSVESIAERTRTLYERRGGKDDAELLNVLFDEFNYFRDFVRERLYDKAGLMELGLINEHEDIYGYYATFCPSIPSPIVDTRLFETDKSNKRVRTAFGAPVHGISTMPTAHTYLEYLVAEKINKEIQLDDHIKTLVAEFFPNIENTDGTSWQNNKLKETSDLAVMLGVQGQVGHGSNLGIHPLIALSIIAYQLDKHDNTLDTFIGRESPLRVRLRDINLELQLFYQYSFDVMFEDIIEQDTGDPTKYRLKNTWLVATASKVEEAMTKLGKTPKISTFIKKLYDSDNQTLNELEQHNTIKQILKVLRFYDLFGTLTLAYPIATQVSRMPIITENSMLPSFIRLSLESNIRAGSLADPTNHLGDFDGDNAYIKDLSFLVKKRKDGTFSFNEQFLEVTKAKDEEKLITNPMERGRTSKFNYLVLPDYNSGSQIVTLFSFGRLAKSRTNTIENANVSEIVSVNIDSSGNDTITFVDPTTNQTKSYDLISNEGMIHDGGIVPQDLAYTRLPFSTVKRVELGNPLAREGRNETVPALLLQAIALSKNQQIRITQNNYLLSYNTHQRSNSPLDLFDYYGAIISVNYNGQTYYTTVAHLWIFEMLTAHLNQQEKTYIADEFITKNLFSPNIDRISDLTRDVLVDILDYLSVDKQQNQTLYYTRLNAVQSFLRMATQEYNLPRNASANTSDPEAPVKNNDVQISDSNKARFNAEKQDMLATTKEHVFDPDKSDMGAVQSITEILRRSIIFAISHLFVIEEEQEYGRLNPFKAPRKVIKTTTCATPFKYMVVKPQEIYGYESLEGEMTQDEIFGRAALEYSKLVSVLEGKTSEVRRSSHTGKRALDYLRQFAKYSIIIGDKNYIFIPVETTYKENEQSPTYIPGVLIDMYTLTEALDGLETYINNYGIQDHTLEAVRNGAITDEEYYQLGLAKFVNELIQQNPSLKNLDMVSPEVVDHIIAEFIIKEIKRTNAIKSVILKEENNELKIHQEISPDVSIPAVLDFNVEGQENLLMNIYEPADIIAAHKPFTAARGVQYQTTRSLLEKAKEIMKGGFIMYLTNLAGIMAFNDVFMSSMAVSKRFFVYLYKITNSKQESNIYKTVANAAAYKLASAETIEGEGLTRAEKMVLNELLQNTRTLPSPGKADKESPLSQSGINRNAFEVLNKHAQKLRVKIRERGVKVGTEEISIEYKFSRRKHKPKYRTWAQPKDKRRYRIERSCINARYKSFKKSGRLWSRKTTKQKEPRSGTDYPTNQPPNNNEPNRKRKN